MESIDKFNAYSEQYYLQELSLKSFEWSLEPVK